ncbi:MAG TPA: bifunctional oligoribonuclease/PAP phosphatase NrnA [Sedimentisphaerales bacterium]|nr:bifunctional oligoribonuclease/PAP phosphatase NrnA [Sedimentisphaerales bacterium]
MDFQKAVELINKSGNVLITTHTRPDGDACGCIVAISNVLAALGKKARALMLSPMPEWYEFLFAEKVPVLGEDIKLDELIQGRLGEFDLIIIVDTNSYTQLDDFGQYLKQARTPVLVIDHHVTADGLGDVELVDSDAAATGLIVYDLLKFAKWSVTEKIAEALFVAVATDTGWFQFSNTNSRVYRSCAELIDAGANPTEIHHNLYENFSYPRFKLTLAMLNTLELHLDGRFATQHISQLDFQQTGATHKDTENLINECQRISTIEAAALFVELKDGRIRCSLRSTGIVDVSEIAAKFGGGGHKMAAGTFLPGPLEEAKKTVLTEMTEIFESLSRK